MNSSHSSSTPTTAQLFNPSFPSQSLDSTAPLPSNTGLNTLRRLKRALERQESKSRSGIYTDILTSCPAKDSPKISSNEKKSMNNVPAEYSKFKKKSLQIKTNLGDSENQVSSCRQISFDLNSLLNSKENEYTRALQRIESMKRTAYSVSGSANAFPAVKSCRVNTCESTIGIKEITKPVILASPRSLPTKKQGNDTELEKNVTLRIKDDTAPQTSEFKFDNAIPKSTIFQDQISDEPVKETTLENQENTPKPELLRTDVENSESQMSTAKKDNKSARLSKENRELKRKLAKIEQEKNAEIEEIKQKYEQQIQNLKSEIEQKVLDSNKESEIVIETTKEQLDDEIRKNEILQAKVRELEQKVKNNEENIKNIQKLTSEFENMKKMYEEKLSELQESHIEGELASAVFFFCYKIIFMKAEINSLKKELEELRKQSKDKILEINDYCGSEADITDEDQNSSAILEESTVRVTAIHKTENMFEKKNRSILPISDRLRSIVNQIEYFLFIILK